MRCGANFCSNVVTFCNNSCDKKINRRTFTKFDLMYRSKCKIITSTAILCIFLLFFCDKNSAAELLCASPAQAGGQNDFFVQSNVLCDSSFCIRKGNRTDMIFYFLTNANFFSENKSVIMFVVLI